MNAVYGNTGFWSWLRYWYLDSADLITLMLIDKGYYDYDFDAKAAERSHRRAERKERTHEEKQSLFTRMGFGKVKKLGADSPTLTAEEAQRIVMEEIKGRREKGQTPA